MDPTTIRIGAAILAVVLAALIFLRRRGQKAE